MSAYRNPVIPGFHPDPSVCRVGDDYFLVTSSFTYFPGVPIFRSTNLVDWTQIGNVLDRPSQLDLRSTPGNTSLGVFAPTLRHHDGRFWMITTVCTLDAGTAELLRDRERPDRSVVGPDRHRRVRHRSRPRVGRRRQLLGAHRARCDLAVSDRRPHRCGARSPVTTWSGTGMQYPEAPHLLRRGEHWYLLIAEGGTERGHAVSIARGPTPCGPWESCPHNPIISHRSTDRPIQNTGHGDLVEAPDGSWWMVLHGARPQGMTPNFHVLGRETFLVPVEWVDDWPVVGDLVLQMDSTPPGARVGGAREVARRLRRDHVGPALARHSFAARRQVVARGASRVADAARDRIAGGQRAGVRGSASAAPAVPGASARGRRERCRSRPHGRGWTTGPTTRSR